eukprot:COSAG01_NODE_55586_length_324_cov_0.653333_1_plen_61_part_10
MHTIQHEHSRSVLKECSCLGAVAAQRPIRTVGIVTTFPPGEMYTLSLPLHGNGFTSSCAIN